MIVRDEEAHLPACVRSAEPLVDEWIVYDTGSVDCTRRVAADLGCKVIAGEWRDDFAWARNRSFGHATGDWIVMLDADDRLRGAADLRSFIDAGPRADVLYMQVQSPLPPDERGHEGLESAWQPRVFRRSAGVRYEYPVHTCPIVEGLESAVAPGSILHTGYSSREALRRKAERALPLLARLPEHHPHRLYHELRTRAQLGDDGGVVEAAERLAANVVQLPPDARLLWSHALVRGGRTPEAVAVLARGVAEHPFHPDLYFGLLVAGGAGFLGAVIEADRRGGQHAGISSTQQRAPGTAAALVDLGVLHETFLDHESITRRRPAVDTNPGAGQPRKEQ